jgi:hypothetical protein
MSWLSQGTRPYHLKDLADPPGKIHKPALQNLKPYSFLALWVEIGLLYSQIIREKGAVMNRKSWLVVLGCCVSLLFFFSATVLAAEAEPKVGMTINAKFGKPMSDQDAKYLGLDKAAEFTLKDVKAPYLLVEQFSTTCPHCMAQAPVMNNLYNLVQQDAGLKDKLKFVAVGQGNDASALTMWKGFHKVPFPLIPDPNSTFGKAMNFSPYPVTVVMDKTGKVVFAHIGAFETAEEVLKEIKAAVK